jgi:AAA+ superfamily predicted ATPase
MLLERRSTGDVVRNAMVCVMLRLLEFFQGVLFLTCNRVSALDPAFQSRVTCALRYKQLDAAAREKVWRNLLSPAAAARVAKTIDFAALATHALNGREIKNALRLGIALARREGVPLAMKHLEATIAIAEDFVQAVRSGVDEIDSM